MFAFLAWKHVTIQTTFFFFLKKKSDQKSRRDLHNLFPHPTPPQSHFTAPITVIFACWMIMFDWILIPSYQGALLSFFSAPFAQRPVDTLAELNAEMELNNRSLGTSYGSNDHARRDFSRQVFFFFPKQKKQCDTNVYVTHSSKIMSQLFFSIWSLNIIVTKMHNTSF